MKALPLWQPWATLVAIGAKRVETRAYPPERLGLYRGQRIAIHATKTESELGVCAREPFLSVLKDAGLRIPLGPQSFPLGGIVATAVLDRAAEITPESAARLEREKPQEFAFGDYTPGRWAWVLRDVTEVDPFVPVRGSQGTFDVPDNLLGAPPAPSHQQEALAL